MNSSSLANLKYKNCSIDEDDWLRNGRFYSYWSYHCCLLGCNLCIRLKLFIQLLEPHLGTLDLHLERHHPQLVKNPPQLERRLPLPGNSWIRLLGSCFCFMPMTLIASLWSHLKQKRTLYFTGPTTSPVTIVIHHCQLHLPKRTRFAFLIQFISSCSRSQSFGIKALALLLLIDFLVLATKSIIREKISFTPSVSSYAFGITCFKTHRTKIQ